MKKGLKIVSLFLVFCMSFMLAGCDLFTKNNAKYYNQNVITLSYGDGSKIEISRSDFITAYSNYGQTLVDSYNYTTEQAQKATVDSLVNREILLKEAKKVANTQAGASVKLKDEDIKNLYYQTYEAMISNAREYEDAIRDAWDMPKEDTSSEDSSTDVVVYKPYEKKAKPVYDDVTKTYRIKVLEDESETTGISFENIDAIYSAFIAETKNNKEDAFAREEYRRYLASLQSTQRVLGTSYNDEQLIKNEIKRIYDNLEDNKYITKYQEYKQDNNGYSTITVSQVLEKYKSMISISKYKYDNDLDSYNSDMLSKRENVNYFVNDDYFYVAHILIKFSDEQQEEYDSLKTKSNNGQGDIISADEYERQKANLYSSVKASVRDLETGEIKSEDSVSAKKVLSEVKNALNGKSNEQKDQAFRELMYKYNEDSGIMNATYPYVIGEKESQSKMVESFTNASKELNEAGVYGAVSDLVKSEYGLHIIYYMGKCENPFSFTSDGEINLRADYKINNMPQSDVLVLDNTYLNNLNNKTIFDLVYESLSSDNYSQFESMNLNTMKQTYKIEVTVADKLV